MSEYRVSPDKSAELQVEHKTRPPEKLITPLETCKALSEKIEKEIAAIKEELARVIV